MKDLLMTLLECPRELHLQAPQPYRVGTVNMNVSKYAPMLEAAQALTKPSHAAMQVLVGQIRELDPQRDGIFMVELLRVMVEARGNGGVKSLRAAESLRGVGGEGNTGRVKVREAVGRVETERTERSLSFELFESEWHG
jgi:hypothetical protein